MNLSDFRKALDIDMATLGINARELGKRLGVSQQSVSKWRHRGFPPLYRVDELKAIFGPNSNIGRIDFAQFAREVPRLRVSVPSNVPGATSQQASAARAVSASDNSVDIRAWVMEQELGLMRGLPGSLRIHLHGEKGVDYASDTLAVDVVASARGPLQVPEKLSHALLKLLALRASSGKPGMRLAVAVIEGEVHQRDRTAHAAVQARWERMLSEIKQAADALGAEILIVKSGVEVAMAICAIEGVAFVPPEAFDEDGLED
jgi:transcriptional regulator with XRE-family HTH domain